MHSSTKYTNGCPNQLNENYVDCEVKDEKSRSDKKNMYAFIKFIQDMKCNHKEKARKRILILFTFIDSMCGYLSLDAQNLSSSTSHDSVITKNTN